MKTNALAQLRLLGQSIWLDHISRDLVASGTLRRLIEEDGIRGVTSNPAIFEKAIVKSRDYDEDICAQTLAGKNAEAIYETICLRDVQNTADEFLSIYDRTSGDDGYVSLEVNPHLAHDTCGTLHEVRHLWSVLARPNVFIKVPATHEGLPAIQKLISEGINIDVTLIFGLPRYRQVAEAYIAGLEMRAESRRPLHHVASVASFFVSRIDARIDPLLEKIMARGGEMADLAKQAQGQIACASAKIAYQIHKEIFDTARFKKLSANGACVQRMLWASTGTKNAEYRNVKYIDELIGPNTINTAPVETINAYRDHGKPASRLEQNVGAAAHLLKRLSALDIDIDQITQQLEEEGIEKFIKHFDTLMAALATHREK